LNRAFRSALEVYDWQCIDAAGEAGASWRDIGEALGIPRQNAQRKYARRPEWTTSITAEDIYPKEDDLP
jgi:hypothetical protein